MYDVIVIGAGPAGLTASLYAARAGKRVLLLEREVCGGQMARAAWVENYPGCEAAPGERLAKQMQKQAEDSGVELVYDRVETVTRDGTVVAEGGRWMRRGRNGFSAGASATAPTATGRCIGTRPWRWWAAETRRPMRCGI